MALGRKTGGRKKGSVTQKTAELRMFVSKLVEKKWGEMEAIIDETRNGIEIEKTTTVDGKTVTVLGRLNADPKGAGDLILKMAEYAMPKLRHTEMVGEGGGPLEVVVVTYQETQ